MRGQTRILIAMLCTGMLAVPAAVPAQLDLESSKGEYVSLWTNACVKGGSTSVLNLSQGDYDAISMAGPYLEKYWSRIEAAGIKAHPLSRTLRGVCSCMARYIASHKPHVLVPTSPRIATAAQKWCLSD